MIVSLLVVWRDSVRMVGHLSPTFSRVVGPDNYRVRRDTGATPFLIE